MRKGDRRLPVVSLGAGRIHRALTPERLLQAGIPKREPPPTLRLLEPVMGRTASWPYTDSRTVLDQIRDAGPTCESDPAYRALDEYLRKRAV